MKLRQFECLRAIMTTGSMTQAAKSIGISQPSASSLISNMEYGLGFKLFERMNGRLVPTAEAKHILPDVIQTLDSLELTRQKAKQIKDNKFGDLRIAAYPDIAIDFLPRTISRFLNGERSIHVRLHARRSEMMSGLLPAQDFDMAVVTHLSETRNFDVEEIKQPCLMAFPTGHEMAKNPKVRPTDIKTAPLVTLAPDHPTVTQLIEKFSDKKIPYPGSLIETQTFESAASFIRRGTGIGLIDPITAQRYAGNGLVTCPFEPTVYQSIYLLTPADRPVSNLLKLFKIQLLTDLSECQA